jgi:hypothetical protein
MVYAKAGHTEPNGNSAAKRCADHERASEPRSRGIRHATNISAGDISL